MTKTPKILLHVCCAWCLAKTLIRLREEFPSAEIHLLWFNPNIHPLIEYRRRLKAVKIFIERADIPLTIIDNYGLQEFCAACKNDYSVPARCEKCYAARLKKCAEKANTDNYDFFSSTLTASREQNHDLLKTVGESAQINSSAKFLYRDCRAVDDDDLPQKLVNGLYKQSYCGCVFSEQDRYQNSKLHLYPTTDELKIKK